MYKLNLAAQYGLRAIVFTAVVSFLISGLGGVFITAFLERPKPGIVVEGIGFDAGEALIQLPDELVQASLRDSWGRTFQNFETFQALRERDISSSEISQRLRLGLDAADQWLEANPSPTSGRYTEVQLDSHPQFRYPVVGSTFNGMLRRRELEQPPDTTISEGDQPSVYPLYVQDNDPVLHRGSRTIRFPTARFVSDDQRSQNDLLARSFSTGNAENIVHYTDAFLDAVRGDLDAVGILRQELHETLLSSARLSIEVLVTNTGRTAFVLAPSFVAKIQGQGFEETYMLRLNKEEVNEEQREPADLEALLGALLPGGQSTALQGSPVPPEEFLPRAGGLEYVTVPAGEEQRLSLLAVEPLENPRRFKSLYEEGFLPVSLVAFRLGGPPVTSAQAMFGSDTSEAETERTLQTANAVLDD